MSADEADDAATIAASLVDPERFGAIVDTHGPAVTAYLTRRVGLVLAQDLASETFLKAFRSRATYRPAHSTARPWLFGIATNQVHNHARSEQRRLDTLGRVAAARILAASGEDRVDDALTAAATLQRLARCLAGLSSESRDVLLLVGVEGLTYEETAICLDVPIGTVRSRLARTRQALRGSLENERRATSLAREEQPHC